MKLSSNELRKAIRYCNCNLSQFAQLLEIDPRKIAFWLKTGKIPLEYSTRIEKLTCHHISRFNLTASARYLIAKKQSVFCHNVIYCYKLEKQCQKFSVKQIQEKIICKFNHEERYHQAKFIMTHGIYALIEAIDCNKISIEIAFKIATYSATQQEYFLEEFSSNISSFS